MAKSKLFRINLLDFLKGLIMAIGTPLLYFLQEALPTFGLNPMEKIALSALVAYLIKTLVEGRKGKLFSKDGDEDIAGGGNHNPRP